MLASDGSPAAPQHPDSYTPPPSQEGDTSPAAVPGGGDEFPVGSMVWGKLPGYDWWPGCVISRSEDKNGDQQHTGGGDGDRGGGVQMWIKWYGENNLSQVSLPHHADWNISTVSTVLQLLTEKVVPFSDFAQHLNTSGLKGVYKRGVFLAIKVN